jgi:hypothetical protein
MNEQQKLQSTKNYALFTMSADNRAIEINRRKELKASMERYGFLPGFPLMCRKDSGKLIIVDGQHRFMLAQKLGIAVWYTVTDQDVDVAVVNAAQRGWNIAAYVNRYARGGNEHYIKLIQFAKTHAMPIGSAAGALVGHSTASNAAKEIKDGAFEIRNWEYAALVARMYNAIRKARKECATAQVLNAISAICHIPKFDHERMEKNIMRRADMLRRFNNRDACLLMLEEIYNDQAHAKKRRPIAFESKQALTARTLIINK